MRPWSFHRFLFSRDEATLQVIAPVGRSDGSSVSRPVSTLLTLRSFWPIIGAMGVVCVGPCSAYEFSRLGEAIKTETMTPVPDILHVVISVSSLDSDTFSYLTGDFSAHRYLSEGRSSTTN